jgi:flagellar motor switch protein FliN
MSDDDLNQEQMADQWAAAMAAEQASETVAGRKPPAASSGQSYEGFNVAAGPEPEPDPEAIAVKAEPAAKYSIPGPVYRDAPELDVILDISVRLTMELGSRDISIGDLLQLKQGSVLELDQVVGQPLDVMVNGTLIAQGEVVQVNDKYGIRMLDIISQSERIKRLK